MYYFWVSAAFFFISIFPIDIFILYSVRVLIIYYDLGPKRALNHYSLRFLFLHLRLFKSRRITVPLVQEMRRESLKLHKNFLTVISLRFDDQVGQIYVQTYGRWIKTFL